MKKKRFFIDIIVMIVIIKIMKQSKKRVEKLMVETRLGVVNFEVLGRKPATTDNMKFLPQFLVHV